MGIFKDVKDTVKNIFSADDDMVFDDETEFEQEKPANPFLKKQTSKKPMPLQKVEAPNFDLSNHGFNAAKSTQARTSRSNGKIQIYVPKTYEEAFTIIKDVKAGFTAMVNVEVANPQVSQRLIDVVSGAIYALDGDCKKLGEKQYIFSLSTETIGAYDYLPINGEQGYKPQNNGFNFSMGQGFDGGFNQVGANQAQQGFNPSFGQASNQNSFGQNGFGQNSFGQNAFNQSNFGQTTENIAKEMQSFHIPPKSQF